ERERERRTHHGHSSTLAQRQLARQPDTLSPQPLHAAFEPCASLQQLHERHRLPGQLYPRSAVGVSQATLRFVQGSVPFNMARGVRSEALDDRYPIADRLELDAVRGGVSVLELDDALRRRRPFRDRATEVRACL